MECSLSLGAGDIFCVCAGLSATKAMLVLLLRPCVHMLVWEGAGCFWSLLAGATKQALHQAVLGHPALWGSTDRRGVPGPRWHRGSSAGKGPEPRGTPRGPGGPWSHCPLMPTDLWAAGTVWWSSYHWGGEAMQGWLPCKTRPVFTKCGLLSDVLFVGVFLLFLKKQPL